MLRRLTQRLNPGRGRTQHAARSSQQGQVNRQNRSSQNKESRQLAKFLNRSHLNQADGPKNIQLKLNDVREKMVSSRASQKEFDMLDTLERHLVAEARQIHLQSMLLRLIKKAATQTSSNSEALDLVRQSPAMAKQPDALVELEKISENMISHKNLKSMNVSTELSGLNRDTTTDSTLIDVDKIRKNTINFSSVSNRIDKENTGLKNTIIVDNENNLTALKNSIDNEDPLEEYELKEKFAAKTHENFDWDTYKVIDLHKTYTHPNKENHIKVILGSGGFAKAVRLGEDMLTGDKFAIKKMESIKRAKEEVREKEKLIKALSNNPDDLKYFLTADTIAVSVGKDGNAKAYVKSKLQEGDGLDSLKELNQLRLHSDPAEFKSAHGGLMLKTMDALQALNRNNIVHGDLKWSNIIGGKIADIDGLCYKYGDAVSLHTKEYLPPELNLRKNGYTHPTKDSYDKHMSFKLGLMLLESLDKKSDETFPLRFRAQVDRQPIHGFSQYTTVPTHKSDGEPFNDYEKGVIRLAYSLADTSPAKRPTIQEARERMSNLIGASA